MPETETDRQERIERMRARRPKLMCIGCNKTPAEIDYTFFKEENETHDDYVWKEEGTLNRENGHFLCDDCYIKAGSPSSPTGWTAP